MTGVSNTAPNAGLAPIAAMFASDGPDPRGDLRAILAEWAVPPAEFVGKLPKPTKATNDKGRCQECGGYHGLPAVHLDYVGHADVTRILLEIDPTWTWEPVAFDAQGLPAYDRDGGLWIRLTILGVTRLGYGDGPDPKQRIGDALRNAAMRFGVALSLWSKQEWSDTADGTRDTPPPPPSDDGDPLPDGWESWEEYQSFREQTRHRALARTLAEQGEIAAWFSGKGFRWRTLTGEQADEYSEFLAQLEARAAAEVVE